MKVVYCNYNKEGVIEEKANLYHSSWKDAEEFVPENKIMERLDARIKVDRDKLKEMLSWKRTKF